MVGYDGEWCHMTPLPGAHESTGTVVRLIEDDDRKPPTVR